MTPRSLLAAACAMVVVAGCQRAPAPAAASARTPAAAADVAATASPTPQSAPAPATPAPSEASSVFALPGDLHPGMRLADLEARFGKANVQAGEVPGAEGESVEGAVLFPDDPRRRAYLYFDERDPPRLVLFRVNDAESEWSLDNGLRMGTPLAKVVAINGKPIRFSGLEWDYGGAVVSFNGGRLAPPETAKVTRGFQLAPIVGDDSEDADAYPVGEGEYASDDPHYPRQGDAVGVGELSVSFSEDAR
jgi:hypothetical protein